MVSILALASIGLFGYWVYWNLSCLGRNIARAKRSGLPYVVTPVAIYNIAWLLSQKTIKPILDLLPQSWTEGWLPFLTADWVWELCYAPMKKTGDLFLTVSPGAINLWVTDAEAAHQITSHREQFPKPLESYRILTIFGENIITTEGNEWRKHRKVSAPGFNEKNNVMVFAESCKQTQGMLKGWLGPNGTGNISLTDVPGDALRLTLHIISLVGFGVHLLWPGEMPDSNAEAAVFSSNEPVAGHTMSFEHSLETLLERMIVVLLLPEWLMKLVPIKSFQKSYESLVNWRQYMKELMAMKIEEARAGEKSAGMDILGALVKSSYGKGKEVDEEMLEKEQTGQAILSDSDILGNAFVMIVAGHETTANSIHFSLVQLAINPRFQRMAQKEVQNIFGNAEPETWDYDSTINTLLGGILGAILNEELRLMPPVIAIPKSVPDNTDQELVVGGKKYMVPAGTRISLNAIGLSRNPKYWPAQESKISKKDDDLDEFIPERWLVNDHKGGPDDSDHDEDEFGGFTGNNSSAKLFHPVRGAFLPFSDGPRSCIGRRLAQVKVMAVLATIFQKYSIELAVDEWATDDEVSRMSQEEKIALYKKAQEKANATLRTATSRITLKLHPGHIPVRVVRKGEERFISLVK